MTNANEAICVLNTFCLYLLASVESRISFWYLKMILLVIMFRVGLLGRSLYAFSGGDTIKLGPTGANLLVGGGDYRFAFLTFPA